MRTNSLFASAVLLACATSCSSPNPYVEHRQILEQAMADLDLGRTSKAAASLETITGITAAGDPAVQRFFAAYLLTLVHLEASAYEPFLREPVQQGGSFEVRSQASGGTRPSRIGHLMAVTYNSSRGRAWFANADEQALESDGEKLLPPALEELGTENALVYMNLSILAVYSELNFQDRIEEILNGMEELTDLEACEALIEQVDLLPELRPWIYRGVFEHQKGRDERNAYRFAIRARETGKDVESFGEDRCDQIAVWITDESSFRFVSPANQLFDPALEGCTVGGTPNLMYEAQLDRPR